jgi:hypothetical protein
MDKKIVQEYALNKDFNSLKKCGEDGFDLNSLTKKHFIRYTLDEYNHIKTIQDDIKSARFFNTSDERLFDLILEENKTLRTKDDTTMYYIKNGFSDVFKKYLNIKKIFSMMHFRRDVAKYGTKEMVLHLMDILKDTASETWLFDCIEYGNDEAIKAYLKRYSVDFDSSYQMYLIFSNDKLYLFKNMIIENRVNIAKLLAEYIFSTQKMNAGRSIKNKEWYTQTKHLIPQLIEYKDVINGDDELILTAKKGVNDVCKEIKLELYHSVLSYYLSIVDEDAEDEIVEAVKSLIDKSELSKSVKSGYIEYYPKSSDEWLSESKYEEIVKNSKLKEYISR